MTRTPLVAFQPIKTFRAHPFLTVNSFEAWVTQTGPADMVALGPVLTLTLLQTLEAKHPNGTFLLTPKKRKSRRPIEGPRLSQRHIRIRRQTNIPIGLARCIIIYILIKERIPALPFFFD